MENLDSNYLRELIRVLVRNLGLLEREEASCCGATISQCHAIVEVGRKKVASLNELAELLGLDKSTMSRTINNLVEGGLAVREIDETDRRYITIKLTDKGKDVFNTIEDSMEKYYLKVMQSIPMEKRKSVLEALELLVEAVKKNKTF